MEKAVRMMNDGTASAREIAEEIGFSDLPSYYRAFKRYFGTTPGRMRVDKR